MNVFISQPMKNKSIDILRKEREPLVKKLEKEGHFVIDSLLEIPNGTALQCLAKSFELLDQADLVIFMKGWENSRGCLIEYEIVKHYNKSYKILTEEEELFL